MVSAESDFPFLHLSGELLPTIFLLVKNTTIFHKQMHKDYLF